jgi:magnesium-transporting ATPase (P-type)
MDSLRSLSSPTANVVRGGEAMIVPSGEVIPGDLVELKMGDTIPADIRYEKTKFSGAEPLLLLPFRDLSDT